MSSSIHLSSSGNPGSEGKGRGEFLPLVAKSLIITAFVCAFLAAIGWALKLNSTHLTISFCVGGGLSFVGGLLTLALSAHYQKKHALSKPASVVKASKVFSISPENVSAKSTERDAQASDVPPPTQVLKSASGTRKKRLPIEPPIQQGSPKGSKEASISTKNVSAQAREFVAQDSNLPQSPLLILETSLNEWVEKGSNETKEDRQTAKTKILICFSNREISLNLQNLKIKDLPECIFDFHWLEHLHISSTQIETIPDAIGQLKNLIELRANSCGQLMSIPDKIVDCTKLEWLDVSGSQIKGLPDSIGQLHKLEGLMLNGCSQLESIPSSIVKCANLKGLDVSSSRIAKLPEEIGMLLELESLIAYNCSQLKSIPSGIADCTCLIRLDVEKSRIAELPQKIFTFSWALKIYLKNCPLSNSFLEKLKANKENPGYIGPKIEYEPAF